VNIICRQHAGRYLHFIAETVREQRPQGAVDAPGRDDLLRAGPRLALEVAAAGYLPGCIHPFLYIYRKREEINVF